MKERIRRWLGKNVEKVEIAKIVNAPRFLENKIALITGGSSGIGLEIAKYFTDVGCKVIVVGSNQSKLKKACIDLPMAEFVVYNLNDTASVAVLLEEALKKFPEHRIDILVNCAGVTDHLSFFTTTQSDFQRIMRINVEATFFLSQAVGNYMVKNGIKGHILNISSSSGNKPAMTPYKISKWAVRGMTLGLAEELTPYGITVNAIAPGKTATPMMDFIEGDSNLKCTGQLSGRYILPREIAYIAAVLVSDFGNMIIGDTVYVSGGNGTVMS